MARRQRPAAPDLRTDAREHAMLLLYEAEQRSMAPSEVVAAQVSTPDRMTSNLIAGVEAHRQQLDELIAANAKGWTLARMPTIDVTILRIAGFELLGSPDVPLAVVIDEAVELAKRFSTDDSGKFVNGVLSSMAKVLRPTA